MGRALTGEPVAEVGPPAGVTVEHIVGGMQVLHPGQGAVVPVHDDLPAARVVGGLGAQTGKPGALRRAGDDQILARLDVHTYLNQQFCVFFELFFHEACLLRIFISK